MSRSPVRIRSVAPRQNPRKVASCLTFRGFFFLFFFPLLPRKAP
nr:MAG TPA: hypothetical protein [Caudoviricetes sp.]